MREKNLTLETAAEIARTAEAARKQLQQTARNQSVHGVQYKKGSQNQKKTLMRIEETVVIKLKLNADTVAASTRREIAQHTVRQTVRVVRKTTLRKCADQRTLVRLRIGLSSL